jgi:Domain of unknown function (DUF4186)
MTKKLPLEVNCKASRCTPSVPEADRRHSFSSPLALPGIGGSCTSCGANGLVDWERLHRRDQSDIEATVDALRLELIRDNYWAEPLPHRVIVNASRRGLNALDASASLLLREKLQVGHFKEGYQTHFAYHPKATLIHCAMHATGTCCRGCLEKWFGIPMHLPLSEKDLSFCRALVNTYAQVRLSEPDNVLRRAA